MVLFTVSFFEGPLFNARIMKKTVLIIEDDESASEVMEYVVNKLRMESMTSTYCLPVRDIQFLVPDLILLDHQLGDKSGSELCLNIKNNRHIDHIPVIIVSASMEIKKISRQCRADDYLQKPFTAKDLEEKIKKHLP